MPTAMDYLRTSGKFPPSLMSCSLLVDRKAPGSTQVEDSLQNVLALDLVDGDDSGVDRGIQDELKQATCWSLQDRH